MTNEEKFNLIKRNLEEVLTEVELKQLIDSGTPLKYIGNLSTMLSIIICYNLFI
ncbi:MAG: hypothetical protein G01um10147_632 [Microgenomates group bacterium Gr01-1014_7]|nr:MAG: hypothetical protein G01um10147_632 [Microgenomates group bacterium Gr01-1014_7]